MSSGEIETVWQAEPHTIAKIKLLSTYLKAWFSILGTNRSFRGAELLYVDGFAGLGEYTNSNEGSPLAALNAAISVRRDHGASWSAGKVHCAFVEIDKARFANLRRKLDEFDLPTSIDYAVLNTSFVDGIAEIKGRHPRSFGGADPLFVFIDPFGATGTPFRLVEDILRSRTSEVLINLDVDGIGRIYKADSNAGSEANLNEIFGDNSWRQELSTAPEFSVLCKKVVELYKNRLRSLPKVKYVFSFEMRGRSGSLNYYLVFASQKRLGLEKMKEAMRGIDQTGDYVFCDADVNQMRMFGSDDVRRWATSLFHRYRGKRATFDELWDYSLNETGMINPKSMLKWLEYRGAIAEVEQLPGSGTRRKGSFPEDKVKAVSFAGEFVDAEA